MASAGCFPSCNGEVVVEGGEQDTAQQVHPDPVAELGVMWREKRLL